MVARIALAAALLSVVACGPGASPEVERSMAIPPSADLADPTDTPAEPSADPAADVSPRIGDDQSIDLAAAILPSDALPGDWVFADQDLDVGGLSYRGSDCDAHDHLMTARSGWMAARISWKHGHDGAAQLLVRAPDARAAQDLMVIAESLAGQCPMVGPIGGSWTTITPVELGVDQVTAHRSRWINHDQVAAYVRHHDVISVAIVTLRGDDHGPDGADRQLDLVRQMAVDGMEQLRRAPLVARAEVTVPSVDIEHRDELNEPEPEPIEEPPDEPDTEIASEDVELDPEDLDDGTDTPGLELLPTLDRPGWAIDPITDPAPRDDDDIRIAGCPASELLVELDRHHVITAHVDGPSWQLGVVSVSSQLDLPAAVAGVEGMVDVVPCLWSSRLADGLLGEIDAEAALVSISPDFDLVDVHVAVGRHIIWVRTMLDDPDPTVWLTDTRDLVDAVIEQVRTNG